LPMRILHFVYMNGDLLHFFQPEEIVFGYTVGAGRMRVRFVSDFSLVAKENQLFCKSFFSDQIWMHRKLEVNTADFRHRYVFFQYQEPIPYEVVNLYKHKIISALIQHIPLDRIIDGLNHLLNADKSLFNEMYLDWIDQITQGICFSEDHQEEESTRIRSYINLFANHYITELFGRVYARNLSLLKDHLPLLSYKMYEMKDMHDRGMVSIL